MTARRWLQALVFSALTLLPAPADGWGKDGHQLVCEIAWRRLSPAGRRLVEEIRAADRRPKKSFARSCVWADRVRRTTYRGSAEYHFINITPNASGVDLERDCPAHDCVPIAIRRYAAYLASPSRSAEEKAPALKFLGHFVGDIHQPLHAGRAEDRGGNDIPVRGLGLPEAPRKSTNLHLVWDVWLLRHGALSYPASLSSLETAIDDDEAARWQDLDIEGWASEAYRLAVDVAYDIPDDRILGAAYFERAVPVASEQLQKAGVRLAHLLDSIADGSFGAENRTDVP